MILVVGHAVARSDTIEQMLQLSIAHVLRSRAEPGCISHEVSRDALQPLRLTFVERWSDLAALQVHFHVEETRQFGRALAQLAENRPEMTIYQADSVDLADALKQRG